MADPILPKRSNSAANVPDTADLIDNEFAINTADKIIYQRVGAAVVAVANFIDAASETVAGKVERATDAEFTTGSDTTRYVNAAQVKSVTQTLTNKTIALGSNTVSGTTAQFQAANTDGNFLTVIEKGFTIESPAATDDVPLFRAYRDLTIVHL